MFSARFSLFGMAAAQSNGSPHLVISTIFREGTTATDRVEKSCAQAYRKTNTSLSPLPSPFLRGKGDRLRWMRVDLTLLLSLPITRTVSPSSRRRQGAMADGSLRLPPCPLRLPLLFPKSSSILFGSPVCARQLPPRGEAMHRAMFGTAFIFYSRSFDSLRSLRMTEGRRVAHAARGVKHLDNSFRQFERNFVNRFARLQKAKAPLQPQSDAVQTF